MADPAEQSYDRANEFGWKEGDIEILEPGTVEPLLSEEELERIVNENGPPHSDEEATEKAHR